VLQLKCFCASITRPFELLYKRICVLSIDTIDDLGRSNFVGISWDFPDLGANNSYTNADSPFSETELYPIKRRPTFHFSAV